MTDSNKYFWALFAAAGIISVFLSFLVTHLNASDGAREAPKAAVTATATRAQPPAVPAAAIPVRYVIVVKNKAGYMDAAGKTVIPPIYDDARPFGDNGLAAIMVNNRYGYINTAGQMVIPPRWKDAGTFHDGRAAVKDDNDRYGYIDAQGNTVVAPGYDSAAPYSEGLAAVSRNGRYGYIDTQGHEAIPLRYEMAGDFHDGLAAVMLNNMYGLINRSARLVVQPHFEMADSLGNGLMMIKSGGYAAVSNTAGQVVVPADKYIAIGRYEDDRAEVQVQQATTGNNSQSLYGYIDPAGREVIPARFAHANTFSEGLAYACEAAAGPCGFIDTAGNWAIRPQFAWQYSEDQPVFRHGLALVHDTRSNRDCYINKQGACIRAYSAA